MEHDRPQEDEGDTSLQVGDTFACERCGTIELHDAQPNDEVLSRLAGFNLVRASNILARLPHQHHGVLKLERAARKAYLRVHHLRRSSVPERLAQKEFARALETFRDALFAFEGATSRQIEAEDSRRGAGTGVTARRGGALRTALSLTRRMQRTVHWLLSTYSFNSRLVDFAGNDLGPLTLPGTRIEGRPGKMALAEVYAILAKGGFSQMQIAKLNLDGELGADPAPHDLKHARERVRAALRTHRARAKRIEDTVDRELIDEWSQRLDPPKDPPVK